MPYEYVQVLSVTACFAPNRESVSLEAQYPGPIRRYKVQVYDFDDNVVYDQETLARVLPLRINGWRGEWQGSPRGETHVNPLLSPFRVTLQVEPALADTLVNRAIARCPSRLVSAAKAVAGMISPPFVPTGLRGADWNQMQPRIGRDLTTVRYSSVAIRLKDWDTVYREQSGGRNPAVAPFTQARNIKIMWVQARLNSIGCFAGPVTGDESYVNRNGSNALGNALFRYRMGRRIPSDGVSVPQNGPALPAGLASVNLETFCDTNPTSAALRNTWDGSDFNLAAAGRASLKLLRNDDELNQIIAFLAMENPEPAIVKAKDPLADIGAADFADPIAKARFFIDSTRCPNNNRDEWVEYNYIPGYRPATHKFEKERDWLTDPALPIEAVVTIEDSGGASVQVPEAMGDVRIKWSWTDSDELDLRGTEAWVLPAPMPDRPTRAAEYVQKTLPTMRRSGGFYKNCPQNCGGIVSGTDAVDFEEVFRAFRDGAICPEKASKKGSEPGGVLDPSGPSQAAPSEQVSRIWFRPSLIAGDNYQITAQADFSKGYGGGAASDARRNVLEQAHKKHSCNRPGADPVNHSPELKAVSCFITGWRRLRLRMFVMWPDRRAWGAGAGQMIFNGLNEADSPIQGNNLASHWEELRLMFQAAYMYVPPLTDIRLEPMQANFTPTFDRDYIREVTRLPEPFRHLLTDVDLTTVRTELTHVPENQLSQSIVEACRKSIPAAEVTDVNLTAFCQMVETWKTNADDQVKRAASLYATVLDKLLDYDEISAGRPGKHKYPSAQILADPKYFITDPIDSRKTIKRLDMQPPSALYTAALPRVRNDVLNAAIIHALNNPPAAPPDPAWGTFCILVKTWKEDRDAQVKALGDHYATALTELMNYGKLSQGQTGNTKKVQVTRLQTMTAYFEQDAGGAWHVKPKVFAAPTAAYNSEMAHLNEDSLKQAIIISANPPGAVPPTPVIDANLIAFIQRVNSNWLARVPNAAHSDPANAQFPQYVTDTLLKSAGNYYKKYIDFWIRPAPAAPGGLGFYNQDMVWGDIRNDQVKRNYLKPSADGSTVLQEIKLWDPLPECRPFCRFDANRLAPGRLPDGLTLGQLRAKNADALAGNFAYVMAMLLDKAVDRKLRHNLVAGGKFTHRQDGIAIVDNHTLPSTLDNTGAALAPFGLSMFTPLDLVFTSFNTPYLYAGTLSHELGHALFLKHWQNAAGGAKTDHDQADSNCVMSYPILLHGEARNLAAADPPGARELSLAAQKDWLEGANDGGIWLDKYTKLKTGGDGYVRVVKKHFLPQRYRPHFCGKCNLNLRGWNIYCAGLPMASKAPQDGQDYLPAAGAWQPNKAQGDSLWP